MERGLVWKKGFCTVISIFIDTPGARHGYGMVRADQRNPRPRDPRRRLCPQEELKAFLARPLIARLATVRANRSPQLTPMRFSTKTG